MTYIPAYLNAWYRHIRYSLSKTDTPSHSETIRPLRFDDEHYGRYRAARKVMMTKSLDQLN